MLRAVSFSSIVDTNLLLDLRVNDSDASDGAQNGKICAKAHSKCRRAEAIKFCHSKLAGA